MSSSNKIAKNTLYLYLRMLFVMGVSLYTSRIVLHTLGVEDFGMYNLIGGVVVLFSFLNNAMSNSSQRFLNIEISKKIKEDINKVFNTSLTIHILISIIVLILSETIGLWFLNNKLNIPINRMYAANVVYQMSILTTLFNILRIPYNATILANERMSFYAILGVLETIMKLVIVYLLLYFKNSDYLITYSILLVLVSIIVNFSYIVYCRKNYKIETKIRLINDKPLFKEMISFSGWSLFGQTAVLGSTQGLNMILNIFVGVTVNAALGIANQINGVIYNFVSNMQVAFNPRIIQSYAEGDLNAHKDLILNASRYSTYLFLLFALPFLVFTKLVTSVWLGNNLPEYVVEFTQIIIVGSIINSMVGPFWMSANAIGNIRTYQIIIACILLLNLPIAYILLKFNYSPIFVMATQVGLNFFALIFRIFYVNQKLRFEKVKIISYLKGLFFPFSFITIITYLSHNFVTTNVFTSIYQGLSLELILIISIIFSLNEAEKRICKDFIINKIKRHNV